MKAFFLKPYEKASPLQPLRDPQRFGGSFFTLHLIISNPQDVGGNERSEMPKKCFREFCKSMNVDGKIEWDIGRKDS